MSASFHIRRAVLSDLQGIVANNIAMAKETENLELSESTVTQGVKAVLEGHASGAWYYVLHEEPANNGADKGSEGEVVAQLMITIEWSDWRSAPLWWIQSVYVLPRARRQGYFKRLYEHAKAEAQAEKAGGLRLYVDEHNVKAQATYESLGMTSHYKVYEDMFTGY